MDSSLFEFEPNMSDDLNSQQIGIVDPDETAHYEPSHLDLHCLQKYIATTLQQAQLGMIKIGCCGEVTVVQRLNR